MTAPTVRRLFTEPLVLDDVGPARPSRSGRHTALALVLLSPMLVSIALLLVWPAGRSVYDSVIAQDGDFAAAANYVEAFRDPQLRRDLANTGLWALVVPVLVVGLGYLLAALLRFTRANVVFAIVLMPMALPLVVTGVAFRLMYDPSPRYGPATAVVTRIAGLFGVAPDSVPPLLGSSLVTASLMSAFIWTWVGLAAAVFRTALDDIPPELEDAVRAEGGDSWRVFRDVQWPFVRRVVAVLTVLVAVAASRTFDLVLVMAPGSVQDQAEVLALYLLRQPNIEAAGNADAVGVLWLVLASAVAVVVAMLTSSGARGDWPVPSGRVRGRRSPGPPVRRSPGPRVRQRDRVSTGRRRRFGDPVRLRQMAARVTLALVIGVWALPLVLLLVTSFHAQVDQVSNGWRASLSMASYTVVRHGDLGAALLPTAAMASAVTVVVVVAGALAGYALAWLDPPGRRIATTILVIASVVPIQAVARPLHEALFALGIEDQALILTIVHIGRGVPLAALVLRNSFATMPSEHIRGTRWGSGDLALAMARITGAEARPALIAVLALEFMFVWNDLVVGFLFGGAGFSPVGMVLFGQTRQFVTGASVLAAGSVLASLVPIVVVLAARRSIIDGLAPRAAR